MSAVACPVRGAKRALHLSQHHFMLPLQMRDSVQKIKQRKCSVYAQTSKREPKRKDTVYESSKCEVVLCV